MVLFWQCWLHLMLYCCRQLHMAIIQLVGGIAEYMIMRATDYFQVNLMNDLRQTPLHLSVITNQPHISKKLMLSGALLELTDNKGNTALHIACKEGYRDCVEVLTTPFYSEDVGCPYALPVQNVPQNLETVNYEGNLNFCFFPFYWNCFFVDFSRCLVLPNWRLIFVFPGPHLINTKVDMNINIHLSQFKATVWS